MFFFLIIAAMFIFILFSGRGQKKREEQRMAQVNALQKGDGVILPGGVIGTVAGFKDNALEVKIAENVKITVLKSGIVGVVNSKEPAAKGGSN